MPSPLTTAIMKSTAEGQCADVVIAIAGAMDRLCADRIVRPETRVCLADSILGVGVREGRDAGCGCGGRLAARPAGCLGVMKSRIQNASEAAHDSALGTAHDGSIDITTWPQGPGAEGHDTWLSEPKPGPAHNRHPCPAGCLRSRCGGLQEGRRFNPEAGMTLTDRLREPA